MKTKDQDKALLYALKLLSMRMHSEKELTKKLYAKKFHPAEIHALLEKLKERKLIDDSVFTRTYVDQLRNKATGDIRIKFQLKKKGLSEKTIENCFSKENADDQRKRALEIASLKLKPGKGADPKERKRIFDYLVRKGFDFEICRDVMGKLMKMKDASAWD